MSLNLCCSKSYLFIEGDILQLMAGERIENISETTTGYKRKALFYINAKFDTASQKFVSRVSFPQRSLAANDFGSAEF